MMKTVELREALTFTCEECGRDVLVRGMPMSRSQISQLEEEGEIDEEMGECAFFFIPGEVKCSYCGAQFATEMEIIEG